MKHLDDDAMVWSKSSFSTGSANCVEVAIPENVAAVRDTKHRDLGALVIPGTEWRAFLSTAAHPTRG